MSDPKVEKLIELREQARMGGGAARIEKQRKQGKMTARERIEVLVDRGSFHEIDSFVEHRETNFGMGEKKFLGDSVVTLDVTVP